MATQIQTQTGTATARGRISHAPGAENVVASGPAAKSIPTRLRSAFASMLSVPYMIRWGSKVNLREVQGNLKTGFQFKYTYESSIAGCVEWTVHATPYNNSWIFSPLPVNAGELQRMTSVLQQTYARDLSKAYPQWKPEHDRLKSQAGEMHIDFFVFEGAPRYVHLPDSLRAFPLVAVLQDPVDGENHANFCVGLDKSTAKTRGLSSY